MKMMGKSRIAIKWPYYACPVRNILRDYDSERLLTSTLGGNPGPLSTWLASQEALRAAGPRFAPVKVWEYDE
jgi:hypothetical protein